MNHLSFPQACEYLAVSPETLTALHDQGLVACQSHTGKQVYPRTALEITKHLLDLGQERHWNYQTLAWYGDLVFATEVGRAVLLPIEEETKAQASHLSKSWLSTQYASAVRDDLKGDVEYPDGPFITLLRSCVAVGEGQFWPDVRSLEQSALFPIITYFEKTGIPILEQRGTIARDAGPIFGFTLVAFIMIAPPISEELADLTRLAYSRLKGLPEAPAPILSDDRDAIISQALVAVDKLYASKATEIHSPPEIWDVKVGVLVGKRRTITLEMKLPPEATQATIDNIIDFIRPWVGAFGARVVHLLYEIANDPPYWRNPLITVETNELLDRLGVKRDSRGVHYSRNRERLRDALNAAHNLEIVGEYITWEGGEQVRKATRRTVLSLIGATFSTDDTGDLSTAELLERGLPKSMQIRLNFYDGVRRPNGKLGNQYVLMSRLPPPAQLPSASHSGTSERLEAYFLFRYRQTQMKSLTLSVTRQTALEKANITNKNSRQATITLRKALDLLVAKGVLANYSTLPTQPHETFDVVLSDTVVYTKPDD